MEATLRNTDGATVTELEAVEGSHIYLKQGEQEVFIEWADAGPVLRAEALSCQAKVEDSIRAAAGNLMTLL